MEKKLIGSDGALFIGQYGTEVIAAAVLEKGKFYEVTAIGASTAFPAGAAIGYLVQGDGVITLAADDIALPFDGVKMCDITTWSMDFSKSEIDVSTFCSENKEYRASKYDDITGQLEGIMVTDITDQPDAIMNHFVSVVDESTGTYTINPKSEVQILAQLVTDDSDVAGDQATLRGPGQPLDRFPISPSPGYVATQSLGKYLDLDRGQEHETKLALRFLVWISSL